MVTQKIVKMISHFDKNQKVVLLQLIREIVDTCLHYLLWSIEEADDIEIIVKKKDGSIVKLSEESDGLAGELYSSDGWIARFSKEETFD